MRIALATLIIAGLAAPAVIESGATGQEQEDVRFKNGELKGLGGLSRAS